MSEQVKTVKKTSSSEKLREEKQNCAILELQSKVEYLTTKVEENSKEISDIIKFITPPESIKDPIEETIKTNKTELINEYCTNPKAFLSFFRSIASFQASDKVMAGVLNSFENVNKGAVYSLLLRAAALLIDSCYPDNIKNSEEIYVVSLTNGKIYKQDKSLIKNFDNFAAFRSIEDAVLAISTVKRVKKYLYYLYENL